MSEAFKIIVPIFLLTFLSASIPALAANRHDPNSEFNHYNKSAPIDLSKSASTDNNAETDSKSDIAADSSTRSENIEESRMGVGIRERR